MAERRADEDPPQREADRGGLPERARAASAGARHGGDREDDRTGSGVRARGLRPLVHGRVLGPPRGDPRLSEGARSPLQREERGDGGAPYAAGQEGDRPLPTRSAMARTGARARARPGQGCAPAGPADRPATGERAEPVEVPPPDLPANELRSLRRAPSLPRLPRDAAARAVSARSGAPAELSPVPEIGILEAVARSVRMWRSVGRRSRRPRSVRWR